MTGQYSSLYQDSESSPAATSQSASISSPLSDHPAIPPPHYYMPAPSGSRPMTNNDVPTSNYAAGYPPGYSEQREANVPPVISTLSKQPLAYSSRRTAARQSPSFSVDSTDASKKAGRTPTAPTKRRQSTKTPTKDKTGAKTGDVTARKKKRLERNRESARLSRRRRKQYLEVLEDRVKHLSTDMDEGRRKHAANAIDTILSKRREILSQVNPASDIRSLPILDSALSRTSPQLAVLTTFQLQQLKSFVLPPHSKLIQWLTLQGADFFRGGRGSSERLSAARIGEKMLHKGTDRATPSDPMWPLMCNEMVLSYDQDERARAFQRTLLQDDSSWLERHTARSSELAMQSLHDCMNSIQMQLHRRELTNAKGLTPVQRLRFMTWAEKNADRIRRALHAKRRQATKPEHAQTYKLSNTQHVAANLYIVNHRLQDVLKALPPRVKLVPQSSLKRLSRRASFEALGQQKDDGGESTGREGLLAHSRSFSPTNVSESGDSDKVPAQLFTPKDRQDAAAEVVEQYLGFVRSIIPPGVTARPQSRAGSSPVSFSIPPSVEPFPTNSNAVHFPTQPTVAGQDHLTATHEHPPYVPFHGRMMEQSASKTESYSPGPMVPPGLTYHNYQQSFQPHPTQVVNSQATQWHQPQPTYRHGAPQTPTAQAAQPFMVQYRHPVAPVLPTQVPTRSHHTRNGSFLPHEDIFPSGDSPAAEEMLIGFIEDADWAIGQGVEMDRST